MNGKKILIIDDDINLCQMIELTFAAIGADVYAATDGREGLKQFYEHRPDLVILDVRMPEMDGWETCRQIRLLSDAPILMLTTLHEDTDIVRGLDSGADDYLTKPFSADVLKARARALLRRSSEQAITKEQFPTYSDDYLTIDIAQHLVLVRQEPIKLSATEFRLLSYLLQNAGRVLTYGQILQHIWGPEYQDSVDYVHVYLSHLRRKLEEDPREPLYLRTEHGVGYRFVKPYAI